MFWSAGPMSDPVLPGAELARQFHADVVEPLLAESWPRLRHAAGRLGSGSDVLGLDDAMSRDHDWGCRLTLLVNAPDRDAVPQISELLEEKLPSSLRGFPVRFPVTWDPSHTHKVEVATVAGFAASRLRVNPTGEMSAADWLVLTGQSVLEVTAGPVFTDRTMWNWPGFAPRCAGTRRTSNGMCSRRAGSGCPSECPCYAARPYAVTNSAPGCSAHDWLTT